MPDDQRHCGGDARSPARSNADALARRITGMLLEQDIHATVFHRESIDLTNPRRAIAQITVKTEIPIRAECARNVLLTDETDVEAAARRIADEFVMRFRVASDA